MRLQVTRGESISLISMCVCSTIGLYQQWHQDMGSSEEVAEWVVQQVDEGCCIEVSVPHHLAGKERLPGATAEQASHHPVAHVHVMSHFLRKQSSQLTQLLVGYQLHTSPRINSNLND